MHQPSFYLTTMLLSMVVFIDQASGQASVNDHIREGLALSCKDKGGVWDGYRCSPATPQQDDDRADDHNDAADVIRKRLLELNSRIREESAKKPASPQGDRKMHTPEVRASERRDISARSDFTIRGIARDAGSSRQWPFLLTMTRTPSGTDKLVGRIEWPTLRSINRVSGHTDHLDIRFVEDGYITKGSAILGCRYRIPFPIKTNRFGEYKCRNQSGTVELQP